MEYKKITIRESPMGGGAKAKTLYYGIYEKFFFAPEQNFSAEVSSTNLKRLLDKIDKLIKHWNER